MRQALVVRPRTLANQHSALRLFLKFARKYKFSYKEVTPGQLLVFIEFLAERVSSPDTIKNYLGSIKMCFKRSRYSTAVFDDVAVRDALHAVTNTIRHFPSPSMPISPSNLENIINSINDKEAPTIKCFLAVSFASIFRQSTICPRSARDFDASRQILRADVMFKEGHIWVRHKWSKSDQSSVKGGEVKKLPVIKGSVLCPTWNVLAMLNFNPTQKSQQALFAFRDSGPMPISYILNAWTRATSLLGLTGRAFTMHCLRKGGSEYLRQATGDERFVQDFGGWKSKKSVRRYITSDTNDRACDAFARLDKQRPQPKLRRL